MPQERLIRIALGQEPCPAGYEVIDLGNDQYQIWNTMCGCPYCWVEKHGDKYEIIS